MRGPLFAGAFGLVAVVFANPVPQAKIPNSKIAHQAPSPRKIGPSAIWHASPDFIQETYHVCNEKPAAADYFDCFIDQMAGAGAPADAVQFSRELVRQYPGEVGTMLAIKNIGSADLVSVKYLMRAGNNVGLLLVNREKTSPDVNEPSNLDKSAMETQPWYQSLKLKFPNLNLEPSRQRKIWLRVNLQQDGTLRFTESYVINAGQNDGQNLMCFAAFVWDFDCPYQKLRPARNQMVGGQNGLANVSCLTGASIARPA